MRDVPAGHDSAPTATVPAKPLVFLDRAMAAVIARAEKAARSDASVLISGASGTGKEVLARHIHAHSSRSARPFVAVNCAAIPEALLESELFGHEKGAFSGAIGRRIGKFEAAHAGSLLLDEITEIELPLQAKLLRAIQEREIDRVGGSQPVRVDVRLLATTNRDIQREVQKSTFREDLFYRLNVLAIVIPDLKDRPDDILPLAENFLTRHQSPDRPRSLAPDALSLLRAYHWPGNVRELENVIHRASVLTDDPLIPADALEISLESRCSGFAAAASPMAPAKLKILERDAILSMLQHNGGNRTKTAAALGISVRTLRNKLHRYDLAIV
ncbi:MAG TPA: sigma 54-interacting transcriptional regulator [Rhodopila sp.]|nr:sigma 54-interacting transcriptional regulator [Rhodopila sp.]